MRGAIKLSNIHHVVLVLQDGSLVVVDVKVIRSAEDGHHTGKASRPCFAVHSVAGVLSLMGPDNGQEVILLQKCASAYRCQLRREW